MKKGLLCWFLVALLLLAGCVNKSDSAEAVTHPEGTQETAAAEQTEETKVPSETEETEPEIQPSIEFDNYDERDFSDDDEPEEASQPESIVTESVESVPVEGSPETAGTEYVSNGIFGENETERDLP